MDKQTLEEAFRELIKQRKWYINSLRSPVQAKNDKATFLKGGKIAAQNVLFLKNCPSNIKDSILINCDTKIILDHSSYRKELPNLRDVLSISDDEINMIDSLQTRMIDDNTTKWKEFFIKLGNNPYVFRNEVSPFAAVAFDSRQKTVVRLKQLFEETGSTYAAINRLLEERRKIYG